MSGEHSVHSGGLRVIASDFVAVKAAKSRASRTSLPPTCGLNMPTTLFLTKNKWHALSDTVLACGTLPEPAHVPVPWTRTFKALPPTTLAHWPSYILTCVALSFPTAPHRPNSSSKAMLNGSRVELCGPMTMKSRKKSWAKIWWQRLKNRPFVSW